MKRHLMTLAFAALAGSFLLVGSAQACHKKKVACAAPAPVCAPAPVVCAAPAPVCAPVKKHGHAFKNPMKGMKLGFGHGHKKAACAPAPAPCEQVVYSAPVQYAAPIYAAPQASGQR